MLTPLKLFATAPKGMESLLAAELRALGADGVDETRAGVAFAGSLLLAYRVCLWSRLASRVLLPLASFPAATAEALYRGVRAVDWSRHLAPAGTLAVDFTGTAPGITHSHFGALKVKDAIVDQMRERFRERPTVALERPDIRVNVYLQRERATVSLDLSGESLHRRGYRERGAQAPLKENLAAAVLLRAGWPEVAAGGGALVDPMCGSGTLPIEAAMMAAGIAPGLSRQYFGFLGWKLHDAQAWEGLLAAARQRQKMGLASLPPILGCDSDPRAVRIACANAARAGLSGLIRIEAQALKGCRPPPDVPAGLVAVNPPYGQRLGTFKELEPLYAELGEVLKTRFQGWRAAVLTGNPELGKRMGLRARRYYTLYNGAIECRLLDFELQPHWRADRPQPPRAPALEPREPEPGAAMFANRLRKNLKNLGRWARREGITCYRLYDADLPEYAVAVDLYERWVHVQEYQAPASVEPERARARLAEVMSVLPQVLQVAPENVFLKVRRRQKGLAQYEKLADEKRFHEVCEGPCRFLANLTDYLDTGLFLDHRLTRALLGRLAAGQDFLNLFGYTGTASVCAAHGGARSTTTVDLSRTYLTWARRNLALNGLGSTRHALIQADVPRWLKHPPEQRRYGLIFLDPPTFSASKRMQGTLDVQRDHVELIRHAAALLTADGVLIFSSNFRRLRLDTQALSGLAVEDITGETIPKDFERSPRIHQCFRITGPRAGAPTG